MTELSDARLIKPPLYVDPNGDGLFTDQNALALTHWFRM
jgi:hypothetical protein